MPRSRRVPKNSIIKYEELKAAAGGSGSGGSGHGSGSGQVIKFFRLGVPPPMEDCAGARPPEFQLPQPSGGEKNLLGRIASLGLCVVGLNLLYGYLHPLSRIFILPLMVYFMWTIWNRDGNSLFCDREED